MICSSELDEVATGGSTAEEASCDISFFTLITDSKPIQDTPGEGATPSAGDRVAESIHFARRTGRAALD